MAGTSTSVLLKAASSCSQSRASNCEEQGAQRRRVVERRGADTASRRPVSSFAPGHGCRRRRRRPNGLRAGRRTRPAGCVASHSRAALRSAASSRLSPSLSNCATTLRSCASHPGRSRPLRGSRRRQRRANTTARRRRRSAAAATTVTTVRSHESAIFNLPSASVLWSSTFCTPSIRLSALTNALARLRAAAPRCRWHRSRLPAWPSRLASRASRHELLAVWGSATVVRVETDPSRTLSTNGNCARRCPAAPACLRLS